MKHVDLFLGIVAGRIAVFGCPGSHILLLTFDKNLITVGMIHIFTLLYYGASLLSWSIQPRGVGALTLHRNS